MDFAGSDTPAAPVMAGAAGYFRPGLRCAPSGLQPLVTFYETTLDTRPYSSYVSILAPMKDVARRHIASWERGRCPRADLQFAPGRLGYQSPGTMTGAGGASLDWDRRRRVTPVQTASQEAWPEADLGDEILPEMRAAVERRQACALQKGARRIARCGGCDPAFAGVPLPSFIS